VSTKALKREVERLKVRRSPRRREIPEDRVTFAKELGIVPDPWQKQLLQSDSPRVLLNCSRQSGKSTMAAILALHQALLQRESLVLVLAPSERQSKELFSRVATFYRTLGHTSATLPTDSARKLGMELANSSRIEALPGTERTIRGFSGVDLLIVDEAARVDDGLYHAVRPMLAVSGGRLLMLSTPYGKRGVFFEAWSGLEDWQRFEVPARDVPRISDTFLEEERTALPERVYRQEYACEFVDTDDAVFGYDLVHAAITDNVTPLFGEAS
jgi:hypothetical protein